MPITPVPSMTPVPNFPALSERAAGTYNSSAYAFGNHMSVVFNGELLAVANNVKENADAVALLSGATSTVAGEAAASAADALASQNAAAVSEGNALTYAQAAGASAGVPTPVALSYLQTNAGGVPFWGSAPVDTNKLDKTGGTAMRLSYVYSDLGAITAGGTATANANSATVFRVQALGALTLVFSNLPTGALSGDIELLCVNFGGKTITWPTGNWIKPDGSYASTPAAAGVTFQTSGTDRVLVMSDNSSISYKVMR